MAALPYMQLYVADYLADTAHLSTVEHGAYLLLIFNYWQRGESFKAPDERSLNKRLASVARLSNDEWTEVRKSLEEFFVVSETEWSHGRIERDLEAVNAKSAKAKAAGKASAASKANGRSTDVQRTFNHTDTDTDTDTEKEKTPGSPAASRAAKKPIEYSEQFEEAWAAYPSRVGDNPKRGAWTAWQARIKAGTDPQAMIDGTLRYADFLRATGKEGTPFVKQARAFFGPDQSFAETWETTAADTAPLEIPAGDSMTVRSALWKLCLECGITAAEVKDQPLETIRDLIRARHPRAAQRPKLRAIEGGRAA